MFPLFPESSSRDNFTPPQLYLPVDSISARRVGTAFETTTVSFTAFDPKLHAQYYSSGTAQVEKARGGNTTPPGFWERRISLQRSH